MFALQKIAREIDPSELSGILVLVQVTNIPSFLGRAVYYCPPDQKNPNRVYPGKADGTFTERLAYTMSNEVFGKSDYYIDLHSGKFNERLVNFLYFPYDCPDADLCRKSSVLAHAMGNTYMIPFEYASIPPELLPSMYTTDEAVRQGVPAIVVELGDIGIVDPGILEFADVKQLKTISKMLIVLVF